MIAISVNHAPSLRLLTLGHHSPLTLVNSLTNILVRKSLGGNKKLSGGNEKLPLRRFPTVEIV